MCYSDNIYNLSILFFLCYVKYRILLEVIKPKSAVRTSYVIMLYSSCLERVNMKEEQIEPFNNQRTNCQNAF